MAFVALTSGACDADSPLDETLFQTIRTNFDDLDSRVSVLQSRSDYEIYDDFMLTTFNTNNWTAEEETGLVTKAYSQNDHYIELKHSGGTNSYNNLLAVTTKVRVIFDTAHVLVCDFRFKHNTNPDADLFIGLQDATLSGDNILADVSDCIGIHRVFADATKTVKVRMAKAGTATSSAAIGDTTNWQRVKITVTKVAGGSLTVAAELDGSAISGSPWSTNIPDTTLLRPVIGMTNTGDATDRRYWVDYFLCYWQSRPLSEA